MKRSPIKHKPKHHNNECPKCLKAEREFPYCRNCWAWVGDEGEIHHEYGKRLGGSSKVWCNHPNEHGFADNWGGRLLKYCQECHYKETNHIEAGSLMRHG